MPGSSPEDIANDRTPGSSPADTSASAATERVEDVNTAGSSTAGAEDGKSYLDAISDALQKSGKSSDPENGEGSAANGANVEAEGDDPEDDGEPLGELTGEELSRYTSKTRKRIKGLIAERDQYKGEAQSLQSDAAVTQKLIGFMDEKGITSEDVNAAFNIMALMRSDPAKAYEALTPIVLELQSQLGITLPNDLQDRVNLGYITREDAQALARARANEQRATRQAAEVTQRSQQRDEQQVVSQHVSAVSAKITEWETTWSKSDPDYKRKQPFVQDAIEKDILRNGFPRTVQDAIARAESAKKMVEDRMRSLVPSQRREIRPETGAVSPGGQAKPKTMEEAMAAALRSA